MKTLVFLCCLLPVSAETLHYSINWASGLSVGEATVRSDKSKEGWDFEVTLDASVPGFPIQDRYHATATSELCSLIFEKFFVHGKRKTSEKVTFDQQKNTATRETLNGGGKSEISVPANVRDALTYMQYARRELSQGRMPPQQAVVFGGAYQVKMDYTGMQRIKVGDQMADADRIVATIKGPQTDVTIEVFFARDAARTPLLARIPLAYGSFTVELVR